MKTKSQKKETRIRLNHPCKICKEIIYIGEGTIMNGEPYHFECFADECREQGKLEQAQADFEMFEKFIKKHQEDFNYNVYFVSYYNFKEFKSLQKAQEKTE
jgi:hypothetical protein